MALSRVRKTSLVQNIVDQIEDEILSGTYKSGDKLPPLQKLQQIIGASQGTLREALRILEQKGLIEIRQGIKGGAFIRESSTESVTEGIGLLIRQRSISYSDIAAFRKVTEAGLIRLVVENATAEDIVELKRGLEQMHSESLKGLDGWQEVLDKEVMIRKTLIRIADNKMYEAVLVPIHENIFAYARQLISAEGFMPMDAYEDWANIISAIEQRDTDKAVDVTIYHIERYVEAISFNTEDTGK